jgi:hypothetical protein
MREQRGRGSVSRSAAQGRGQYRVRRCASPESDIWTVLIETADHSNRSIPPTRPNSQFETLSGEDEHPVAVTEYSSIAEAVTELLEWLASRP